MKMFSKLILVSLLLTMFVSLCSATPCISVRVVSGASGAGILSSQSHAVNVTGTAYQSTYNSNTQIDSSLLVVFSPICFILFVGILLMAFKTLKSKR